MPNCIARYLQCIVCQKIFFVAFCPKIQDEIQAFYHISLQGKKNASEFLLFVVHLFIE